jgi:nicotinamidase-related amidase
MAAADRLSVAAEPRDWPLLGPAEPDTVALVVIDMQVDFVRDGGWFGALGFDLAGIQGIVPTIRALLDAGRAVPGLQVVHTRQGNSADLSDLPATKLEQSTRNGVPYGMAGPFGRGLIRGERGWDLIEELGPLPTERIVEKPGFSAFVGTDLDPWLKDQGIGSLILTGVTANVCVLSTLYAAVDLGYDCLVVPDAVAGATPDTVRSVVDLVRYQGGLFGGLAESTAVVEALAGLTA